jgi:hypothetical protein
MGMLYFSVNQAQEVIHKYSKRTALYLKQQAPGELQTHMGLAVCIYVGCPAQLQDSLVRALQLTSYTKGGSNNIVCLPGP